MTLRWLDGFDHLQSSDLAFKYEGSNAPLVTSGANTRWGTGQSYQQNNDTAYLYKALPPHATYTFGASLFVTAYGQGVFQIIDNGVQQVLIFHTTAGVVQAYRGPATGNVLLGASAPFALPLNRWVFFETKVTISDTVGSIEVRVDGGTILNLTNVDNSQSGVSQVSAVSLGRAFSGSGGNIQRWDDFYACDGAGSVNNTFLGDCRVYTLYPTGASADGAGHTQWTPSTGSNYQAVDDPTHNGDTDYVSSSTVGQVDTYAFGDLPSSVISVYGIQSNLVARRDDAGARSIQFVQRSAGTDYTSASVPVLASYFPQRTLSEVSMATATAWLPSEINSSEFGVRLSA